MKRFSKPIFEVLRGMHSATTAADVFQRMQTGWPVEKVLPYLFVDWTGGAAYREVSLAALSTARRHCGRLGAALVLGCGGGRLVNDLGGLFTQTVGVDLCLPALLIARHLMFGSGPVMFSLEGAAWAGVDIQPTAATCSAIHLAAADAGDIPLEDLSVDFVVTQYLLDIVTDPARVAREVNRVLAAGGIWFNFGLPFRLASDPPECQPWADQDMARFTELHGFDAIQIERKAFPHLDLSELDRWSVGRIESPVLFAARKVLHLPRAAPVDAFQSYFAGRQAALECLVPRVVRGSEPCLSSTTSFHGGGGAKTYHEIRFGERRPGRIIDSETRAWLEVLFKALPGSPLVGQIVAQLRSRLGPDDGEVVQTLWSLMGLGVLEFDGTPEDRPSTEGLMST